MNLLIITELPAQIPGASPDFWDRLVSEQGVMVTMVFATFLFVLAAGWKMVNKVVDMAAVVGPKLATLAESHTQLARTSSEQLPKLTEGFHGFAKVTTERLDEIREVVSEIKKEVIK